ncbi:hypothetical protein EDB85DRAFT_851878 [Lactarius pseudohatsudake]|nr:hypothetical protein EDB85DRAFT_851878 [Lactarius pseudohatsudake]
MPVSYLLIRLGARTGLERAKQKQPNAIRRYAISTTREETWQVRTMDSEDRVFRCVPGGASLVDNGIHFVLPSLSRKISRLDRSSKMNMRLRLCGSPERDARSVRRTTVASPNLRRGVASHTVPGRPCSRRFNPCVILRRPLQCGRSYRIPSRSAGRSHEYAPMGRSSVAVLMSGFHARRQVRGACLHDNPCAVPTPAFSPSP